MKLELYYFYSCPFCQKVLRFLNGKDHNIKFIDTMESKDNLRKLVEISGKKQVPCLVIDGKPMLESDDIIEFLSKKL